jgi:uncharacterized protein (DUF885 family)
MSISPKTLFFVIFSFLGVLGFSILSPGCTGTGSKTSTENQKSRIINSSDTTRFHKMLQDYYEDEEKLFPVNATSNGDNRYNDQFPVDISDSYQSKEKSFCRQYLDSLKNYTSSNLTDNDRVSYDVMKFDLQNSMDGLKFKAFTEMPINQIFSTTLMFGQLGSGQSFQPFNTVKDYTNFLQRMNGFSVWCDTAIRNMRRGMTDGNVLPTVLVEKMIPQMQSFIVSDPKKSLFFSPIGLMPKNFTNNQKDSLSKVYEENIKTKIIPSYTKLYNFLKTEYLPKSRLSSGIGSLPMGKEIYDYSIQNFTTTKLSADSIFNLGLKEVARIHKGIDSLREVLGFKGNYSEFLRSLKTEPKIFPFTTDQQILDRFQEIYNKEKPAINKLFGKTPKTKFEIRKTEDFRAKSASSEYNQGTPDGKRPGIFYTPILDPKQYSSLIMESLFLHEAIPGHHFQISLQNENTSLPMFRRFYGNSAFAEGWALYSESLGKELGEYTDPYMLLGHLSADMHRAIRLVVDVGMHSKGWSREKAIAFALANEPITEEATVAEIERYMAAPGQALSYKIGALKIKSLRSKYEKELGSKFNLASFHDALLSDGCLPLQVLEDKMNRWEAAQK